VLSIVLAGIVFTVVLFILGDDAKIENLKVSNVISGICGGVFGLSISRMAHLVWLDLDIVRLQRKVVESSAEQRQAGVEHQEAKAKVERMKEAMGGAEVPQK
jgi:ribosome-interacting GTPase 1